MGKQTTAINFTSKMLKRYYQRKEYLSTDETTKSKSGETARDIQALIIQMANIKLNRGMIL